MSNVQDFIDRQIGIHKCSQYYDTAIRRLRCNYEENYSSITQQMTVEVSEPPVFACKFARTVGHEHILALANEDGQLAILDTEHKPRYADDSPRHSKTAHYNAIFDVAWMFGQMKIVSVSGDHTARLFEVTQTDIVEERIFHGHTRSVKTVACRKDDPAVFATGARDGAIFVWDTRANSSVYVTQPDRIIANSHNIPNTPGSGTKFRKKFTCNASGANSVTGLVFQNDMSLISCGAGDGSIKVWDLRKNYGAHKRDPLPKFVIPYSGSTTRNGFSNLLVDQSGIRLYASCMDNTIYCYNIATYQPEPLMLFTGHQNSSFYVKTCLSKDDNYLISGSGDQHAYIWRTDQTTPLVRLEGHTAEVTCVAWCPDGNIKLVTCSDDMRHKIWRVDHESDDVDWTQIGRGSAVNLCYNEENRSQASSATPSSSRKRILNRTPHSQRKRARICERCQMLTPGSAASLRNCENCVFIGRSSSKRSATQAGLSEATSAEKRQNNDKAGGARRLFGSSLQDTNSAVRDDGVLAVILEETSPAKENSVSITANLPNFVVDGEAPHLKNFSPQKKQDRDWLTKIRIEQSLRNQMEELSRPSSPKQRRLNENSSNGGSSSGSAKKQKKTATGSTQSPLLKFFRITNSVTRLSSCETTRPAFLNSCETCITSKID